MPGSKSKSKGKDDGGPLLKLLSLILILALLAAAGIDWYIVYLLDRGDVDYARVRRFAGIAGGFVFSLVVFIIVVVVLLFFSGTASLMFKNGLTSLTGFFSILIFIFLICVASINFAIMPLAKRLIDVPDDQSTAPNSKLIKLAIAGAGFGTGLVVLYLLYFVLRGFAASKKGKKKKEEEDFLDQLF